MYTYPQNYEVKTIAKQIEILGKLFPKLKLGSSDELTLSQEDGIAGAEGIFVIPHYSQFGTYNKAVDAVLKAIKASRPFYNYQKDKTGPKYLRQTKAKEAWWRDKSGAVFLPAQFGLLHRGKSVEMVRHDTSNEEVLLGAYEVGIMLLTHPERLQSYDDLWIDCPGDEYSYDGGGVFSGTPFLLFHGDEVRFGARGVAFPSDGFGSASGFSPQSSSLESRDLGSFESRVSELESFRADVEKILKL